MYIYIDICMDIHMYTNTYAFLIHVMQYYMAIKNHAIEKY